MIEDYDNASVDLKWEAPKSDNGAPIQRYIIEKKNKKFGEWEKAVEVSSRRERRWQNMCMSRFLEIVR